MTTRDDRDPPARSEHDVASRVEVERGGAVAVLRLNAPPHNLLTEPLLRSLADELHGLAGSARCAVVCSSGRSFSAGANFRSDEAPDFTDAAGFAARTRAFYEQAGRIFESPIPLVAAVHGAAIGAGFGLALACDLRVVGANGFFQANFVRLGVHPGFALSMTVPTVVGPALAADLFLTARRVGAAEALEHGLAQRTSEAGAEVEVALALAEEVALGAPLAIAATRQSLRRELAARARAAMEVELAEQTRLAGTDDAVEGVAAMLERRQPHFTGR